MKNELKTLYKKNPKLALQVAKVLGYKIKKVKAGLQYAGEKKTGTFAGKITIPIKGDILTSVYLDRDTQEETEAKSYKLDYDIQALESALDKTLFAFFKKQLPDIVAPTRGFGDHASVGFVREVANEAYQEGSSY